MAVRFFLSLLQELWVWCSCKHVELYGGASVDWMARGIGGMDGAMCWLESKRGELTLKLIKTRFACHDALRTWFPSFLGRT